MQTAQEEQYDRQIRLWGIEAQQRMQLARVLVCGLSGLHVEVCKNLVLSGVNVTVCDNRQATNEDLSCNYFLTSEDIGKNRAVSAHPRIQGLNGFAEVACCESPLCTLTSDYVKLFQAVLVTECSEIEALDMSTKCRSVNVPFFWASSFGFEGCFFTDLGEKYEFKDDAKKDSCTMSFPTLRSALDMKLNYLRTKKLDVSLTLFKFRVFETFRTETSRLPTLLDVDRVNEIANFLLCAHDMDPSYLLNNVLDVPNTWAAFLPVCSVLGGILGQEVIKTSVADALYLETLPAANNKACRKICEIFE